MFFSVIIKVKTFFCDFLCIYFVEDGSSSTSTELCDDDVGNLSDLESEEVTPDNLNLEDEKTTPEEIDKFPELRKFPLEILKSPDTTPVTDSNAQDFNMSKEFLDNCQLNKVPCDITVEDNEWASSSCDTEIEVDVKKVPDVPKSLNIVNTSDMLQNNEVSSELLKDSNDEIKIKDTEALDLAKPMLSFKESKQEQKPELGKKPVLTRKNSEKAIQIMKENSEMLLKFNKHSKSLSFDKYEDRFKLSRSSESADELIISFTDSTPCSTTSRIVEQIHIKKDKSVDGYPEICDCLSNNDTCYCDKKVKNSETMLEEEDEEVFLETNTDINKSTKHQNLNLNLTTEFQNNKNNTDTIQKSYSYHNNVTDIMKEAPQHIVLSPISPSHSIEVVQQRSNLTLPNPTSTKHGSTRNNTKSFPSSPVYSKVN